MTYPDPSAGRRRESTSLSVSQSLARLIERDGPLPPAAVILILEAVAEALRAAPGSPVSGSTVSVGPTGEVRLGSPGGVPPTRAGVPGASAFAFMAPERFGGMPSTPESDEYALGALGFYALAGRPPFEGPTAEDFGRQHETVGVPDLTALSHGVPPALTLLLYVALAKSPRDRHGSPDAFLRALGVVPMYREDRAAALAHLERIAAGHSAPRASTALRAVAAPTEARHRPSVMGVAGADVSGARRSTSIRPPTLAEMQRRPVGLVRKAILVVVLVGVAFYGVVHWLEPVEPEGRYRAPGVTRGPPPAAVAPTSADSAAAADEEPALVRGLRAFETGHFAEAIPLFRQAARVDPEDPTPHGYLACVYRMQARDADADRELALTKGQRGAWDRCAGRRP